MWLFALMLLALFECAQPSGQQTPFSRVNADLPKISAFLTKPSDGFLVDIKEISRGHPLLGVNCPHRHAGGHVHFDNSNRRWPKGKDEPGNYPAIYAGPMEWSVASTRGSACRAATTAMALI
jgi:hypothetical protein